MSRARAPRDPALPPASRAPRPARVRRGPAAPPRACCASPGSRAYADPHRPSTPVTRRALVAAAVLALVPAACGTDRSDEPAALVFAAASLGGALEDAAAAFEQAHPGHRVDLHLAGSPTLVLQLREGAPADLLCTADLETMDRAAATGRLVGAPVAFATNRLAIVTAPGNPAGLTGLTDLARPELTVVLAGPDVPAGRYARRALASAGVPVRSVSDEPSVRAAVAKVRLGQADAAVAYATDARAAGDALTAVPVDPAHDPGARYPAARVDGPGDAATADAFLAFLTAPAGRAVLADHGFGAP